MSINFDKLEIRNYKPLGEVVFEYLRNAILSGELKPGERLMEVTIADQLGVSRTPVREAIRKLEKESFVIMVPRKGAYVADLTKNDIMEVLEIRKELEGFAASLSAVRMKDSEKEAMGKVVEDFNISLISNDKKAMIESDNEFHSLIFKGTKNQRLIDIIYDLHDQFQRFRLIYFNEFTNYKEIQQSHGRIFEAIMNGDAKTAKVEAENHIENIRELVNQWMHD
ncbi:GntR family transcriptional regulator [Fusibacter tunisiensis]|jgi:DNA-binding GntR family transcriptional regulator|uniref:DNA-binding GntR family transcriptional regulator n=1 Tax=Fusibacter tunisiensis TaxID=1008308 RepID=A0ABS2MNH3_9FIRM|nr:GntR family transcriptional regulator [Fusibacter tunisiensis]MBM7560955.1 DNA-binding GntR family transcriptional regulator [Fusibacter tunisiensis]